MTLRTIELEQHTAAKVAGFLYLLLMVTAMFAGFYARGPLIVHGDVAQTARNIAASQRLFRTIPTMRLDRTSAGFLHRELPRGFEQSRDQ